VIVVGLYVDVCVAGGDDGVADGAVHEVGVRGLEGVVEGRRRCPREDVLHELDRVFERGGCEG
jgi:hypothetical protein